MKELIFKVTIASKTPLPLSTKEMAENPAYEMYMAEYEEKLFSVMYRPANGFNDVRFIQLMKRKLKKLYNTPKVEYLEIQKKIENN